MPASSAISCVRAPAKPFFANTSSAAARIRSFESSGSAGAGRRPARRLSLLASMHEKLPDVLEHDQYHDAQQDDHADHVHAGLDALVDATTREHLVEQEGEAPT